MDITWENWDMDFGGKNTECFQREFDIDLFGYLVAYSYSWCKYLKQLHQKVHAL